MKKITTRMVHGEAREADAALLKNVADQAVAGFGGSYVAYVVIGVSFFGAAQTALESPFESISQAFWDKRLEAYHMASDGIWASSQANSASDAIPGASQSGDCPSFHHAQMA